MVFHVLWTGDVGEEGNVLKGKVYVAVKLTVTCELTALQEAEVHHRKGGPE